VEPPQVSNQLQSGGYGLGCNVRIAMSAYAMRLVAVSLCIPCRGCRESLRRTGSKLQGNSWAPRSSTGQR